MNGNNTVWEEKRVGEYNTLILTKEEHIAVLTINRPKDFNLVSVELLQEMEKAANEMEQMEDLRAVVINANGDHFSAGLDISILLQSNSQFVVKHLPWLQSVYSRWEFFPVPVIAAIKGICYGSGVEMILGCDIRIAANNARIAIPEVRFGLSPDMGGTVRLTKLVGAGQAKRLIIGCEEIDAAEAKAIGLVEIVVPPEELENRAMKLARKIADQPPMAVKMAKKGINVCVESSVMAGLMFEQAQSTYCCGTEDQNEAVQAFFEKRKPIFHGK